MNTHRRLPKTAIALAVISCGLPLSGFAQPVTTDAYNPSSYLLFGFEAMDPDSRYGVDRNGRGAALRFGKPIAENVDIQFGTSYARSKKATNRYEQNTLSVDALYLFSRGTIRPFVLLGIGIERDKTRSLVSTQTHNSGYVNAGLGLQVRLSDQWGMQADYRRVRGYHRGNDFGFARSNNNYLGIGFTYAFEPSPTRVAQMPAMPEPRREVAVVPLDIPAPVVVAPPPPAPPQARFEKYTLSAVELFGFDSDELKMPQPKLDEIAKALVANPDVSDVVATGFTDRIGSLKYNQLLSQRRADKVRDYLIAKGVGPARLRAQGKGEANPVVMCNDKKLSALIQCLEPNRRVEIDQITIQRRVQ